MVIIIPPDTPRRRVEGLHQKLQSLGLKVYARRDPNRPEGYKVVVDGLKSLNPAHADRLLSLITDYEAPLIEILPKRESPNLRIVRQGEIDP